MGLPISQHLVLRRTEYRLRRSDPRLAALMRNFSKFALDGRVPQHERLPTRVLYGPRFVAFAVMCLALLAVHVCVLSSLRICRTGRRLRAVLRSATGPGRQTRTAGPQVTETRPLIG